jgi:hypothetical protein
MFTYDSVKYHVKKSHKITLKHYKVSVIAKCAKLPNSRYGTHPNRHALCVADYYSYILPRPSGWVEIWSVLQPFSDHTVQRRPDPVIGT